MTNWGSEIVGGMPPLRQENTLSKSPNADYEIEVEEQESQRHYYHRFVQAG